MNVGKPQYTVAEHNQALKITVGVIAFFMLVFTCNRLTKTPKDGNSPSYTVEDNTQQNAASGPQYKDEQPILIEEVITVKYNIVHEASIRYDNGPSYFVLINKVNLANGNFKEDIKSLVDKIVSDRGRKIAIEFFDNADALDLCYKSHYGINVMGRILNKGEMAQLAQHCIASFSGELTTDLYFNTLYFFPSAFKGTTTVGRYVETIEYNPK